MRIAADFRRHPAALTALLAGLLAAATVLGWMLIAANSPERSVQSSDDLTLAQDAAEEDETEAVLDQTSIEVTYNVFLARDPFESIMPEAVDGPADPSDPSDSSDPTQPTDPTDPGDPSRPADTDDGTCRTGMEAVCNGDVIVVTAISELGATIEVNGTPFTVVPGQSFATNYTLLRVQNTCADLLYLDGDEASTFTQCIGGVATTK